MIAEIDTQSIPPEKRINYWRECIAATFSLVQQIEQPAKGCFQARLTAYELDWLLFLEFAGTPYRSISCEEVQNDVFEVVVPIEGATVLQQDGREVQLEPGTLGFFYLGRRYTVSSQTEFRRVALHIPGKELRNIFPACNYMISSPISLRGGAGKVFLETLNAVRQHAREVEIEKTVAAATADALLSLLKGILFQLPKIGDKLPSRLEFYHRERITGYVKKNLRTNLSISAIAKAMELSPRYVHSLFEKEPLSLMKWIWAERLKHCRHDLEFTSLSGRSISEIAYSWGFNDPAHFSRTFRAHFGMSPTKCRERALESLPSSTRGAAPDDSQSLPLN